MENEEKEKFLLDKSRHDISFVLNMQNSKAKNKLASDDRYFLTKKGKKAESYNLNINENNISIFYYT